MPLMIFDGNSGKVILPILKSGRKHKVLCYDGTMKWFIHYLRQYWPDTTITIRGDSHFYSHELMDWATESYNKMLFINGPAKNNVLKEQEVAKSLVVEVSRKHSLY